MRPNSVAQTTIVSSSRPRCLRSVKQPGDRPVDLGALSGVVLPQAAVGVPGAGAAVGAVEDLHEPDAALDQPPGRQAHLAERAGHVLIQAVEPMACRRLVVKPQHLGHGHLHAEGQLVRLDPRSQGGIVGILDRREPIQPAEQLELARLLLAEDLAARRGERQRIAGIDRELNAVVLGTEVARAMAAQPAAAIGDRRAHDHELGQVVVERAQPVVDPRADRGELPLEHMPAGVELQLGAVVVVGRPHRADHRDIVDAGAQVRPPVADLDPGLAALAIADLKRIERLANVAVGVVRAPRSARCR